MATTKLYLDTRATAPGCPAPVKISLCLHGKTATHSTGVKIMPEQWDKITCKIVKHPQRMYLNTVLSQQKNEWDMALIRLIESGQARTASSVTVLKRMILEELDPDEFKKREEGVFLRRFRDYTESREAEGTREKYRQTLQKMADFDKDLGRRTFEEITRHWLSGFDRYMARTAPSANARAIHLRNIRAVFNDALDDEIITCYPFRKFKIKTVKTRKRSLTAEQLRQLISYPVEEYQIIYRDMFMLMFYMIGINAVDLFNAKKDAVTNSRMEYTRAKTKRLYSIKIEDEALELIRKYEGRTFLLNIMDERANYVDFLHRMDKALKQIGPTIRQGLGGKKFRTPLFPELSQYWCRHTWATIAAELDIPKETIAAALGHGGNSVTDIYINFDMKKVDEANRRVIDYVLYDKR